MVETVSTFSFDGLITDLADTRLKISENIEALEGHLLDEFKKFLDLQKGITRS